MASLAFQAGKSAGGQIDYPTRGISLLRSIVALAANFSSSFADRWADREQRTDGHDGASSRRSKMRTSLTKPALAALAIALSSIATPAFSQVQRSFINQSFEQPNLGTAGCYSVLASSQVPGWNTTHPVYPVGGTCAFVANPTSGPSIELWANSFGGIAAVDGSQFAELNANVASRMYQNVCLVTGEQFAWRFSHRGRNGVDVMGFNIAPTPTGTRTSISTSSTGLAWATRSGTYTYSGTSGVQTLGFEAISSVGGDSIGNFLDNIQITLTPYLEFQPGNTSGLESIATANVPSIRVSGTLTAPMVLQISVAGTATRGVDYTTPGGGSTFNVTVPAGDYDGSQAIATGIVILEDNQIETSETINLTITPNPCSPSAPMAQN